MVHSLGVPERIATFKSPYHFLSSLWACKDGIAWENLTFPTVEHAYRWTQMANDRGRAEVVSVAQEDGTMRWTTAVEAHRAAEKQDTRDDWKFIRSDIMTELLRLKFKDSYLGDWLLATNNADLAEDVKWEEPGLGALLMQVRTELRIARKMKT